MFGADLGPNEGKHKNGLGTNLVAGFGVLKNVLRDESTFFFYRFL